MRIRGRLAQAFCGLGLSLAGLFRTHSGFLQDATPPVPSFRGVPQSPHRITPLSTRSGLSMPEIIGSGIPMKTSPDQFIKVDFD
jgi:hypothetical protein